MCSVCALESGGFFASFWLLNFSRVQRAKYPSTCVANFRLQPQWRAAQAGCSGKGPAFEGMGEQMTIDNWTFFPRGNFPAKACDQAVRIVSCLNTQ